MWHIPPAIVSCWLSIAVSTNSLGANNSHKSACWDYTHIRSGDHQMENMPYRKKACTIAIIPVNTRNIGCMKQICTECTKGWLSFLQLGRRDMLVIMAWFQTMTLAFVYNPIPLPKLIARCVGLINKRQISNLNNYDNIMEFQSAFIEDIVDK